MYYVYFLKSKKYNESYVGSTDDLRRRFSEHNKGKQQSTKRYKPWSLVYYEAYQSEKDARERESRLKHHGNAIKEVKKRTQDSTKMVLGRAFTIIELLVAMGVMTIIAIGAISAWKENRNKVIFKQAKENVLLAIEKARNRAATGFGSHGHGVCIKDGNLIIYEENCDSTYTSNARVYLPASVTILNLPVTFQRITGESADKDIQVGYGGKTSTIKVKSDGAIYEANP